jgi:urea transport system permease protein
LQKTRFGLQVRAVTQNRGMASCLGIRTKRVDALVFGLGSGIAGLGGVALSQLGNVGPGAGAELHHRRVHGRRPGRGGAAVGRRRGGAWAGIINKLIEPAAGAVLGKIIVLVFIILFIQRRPQGLFALKGRVEA